jgi:hypothetical protein
MSRYLAMKCTHDLCLRVSIQAKKPPVERMKQHTQNTPMGDSGMALQTMMVRQQEVESGTVCQRLCKSQHRSEQTRLVILFIAPNQINA